MKIAFGYNKRVGKDSACNYYIKKYGGDKFSFAKPLYDILYYAQEVAGFPKQKDRKFLQWVGTEWARQNNDRVWINKLLFETNNYEMTNKGENIYVSDVRFKNEFSALKKNNWILVKITRDIRNNENHQSENDLVDETRWDYVIQNDGTPNFFIELDKLYEKIKNEKVI